jgi:hypothetical protein
MMVNRITTGLVFIITLLLSVKAAPTAAYGVDGFQAGKRDDSEIMRRGDTGDDGNGVDRRIVGNGGHAW